MIDFLDDPTPLECAKEAVQRGWYVFPLIAGTKRPLLPWREMATTDAAILDKWAAKYPDCNWGVDCGQSKLVVLDVDVKKGKLGRESLLYLETENSAVLPPTFTVKTPTGGTHYYFKGETGSSNGFADGLDLKSVGGYVVLYGSKTADGTYDIVSAQPVDYAPVWLIAKGKRVYERSFNATEWLTEPNKPEHIKWAINWLMNDAPESIEGQNGDDTLVKRVFMPLRDGGISEEKALELVLEHYNDVKAFPPWTPEELEVKAANAYKYAMSPAGSKTDEALLATAATVFPQIELAKAPEGADLKIPMIDGSTIIEATIPKRQWILGRRFLCGYITGTFSPGGVGKSALSYLEAMAIATGKQLTGDVIHRRGPVVLFNAEDSLDELKMRLAAVARHYNVALPDLDDVKYSKIFLLSGRDQKLRIVNANGMRNETAIETLKQMVLRTNAVMLVCDPFVRVHEAEENDNLAIDRVVEIFVDLAHSLNISVHLVHHSRKKNASSNGEGEADSARGASSFVNALRLAHTISVMSEEDAKKYGVGADQRNWYLRLDDAKLNLAPPSAEVRWFKKIDVVLTNGEHVGTLQRIKLDAVTTGKTEFGHPIEIEQIVPMLPYGTAKSVNEISESISNVLLTVGKTKSPASISRLIQAYLVKGPAHCGETVLQLEDLGGKANPRYLVRAVQKTSALLS